MPTTVHIPRELLVRADARAKALRISRNKLIVQALEARLDAAEPWPRELVEMLTQPPAAEVMGAIDDMSAALRARRSRKRPPKL